MTRTKTDEQPLIVGVFRDSQAAEAAVVDLSAAGFTPQQITVVCSEQGCRTHFKPFEHQDPAGTHTPAAALAGSVIGATLGGLAVVVGGLSLAGLPLLVAGGMAAWGGGVVGGLVGAMSTRGVEKELSDFYDQALTKGMILVAAEERDPAKWHMLTRAAEIFAEHGSEPLPIPAED